MKNLATIEIFVHFENFSFDSLYSTANCEHLNDSHVELLLIDPYIAIREENIQFSSMKKKRFFVSVKIILKCKVPRY